MDRRSFLGLAGGLAAAVALMKTAPAEALPLDRAPAQPATETPDGAEAAKPEKAYWVWRRPRRRIYRRRVYRRYYYRPRYFYYRPRRYYYRWW